MYSFLPIEQTAGLVLFNVCLVLFIYCLMDKALKPPFIVPVGNRNLTIILMFIFVLFSFWGADWFHYYSEFGNLRRGGRTNLEDVYVWIAQNLSPNYLLFRLVVWGSSLCLLLHMFKRLSIPTNLAIFFFGSIYIIWFSYARVTAAMVLVYYGLTVLYKPYKSKLFSLLLGISAIGCAFYFHKSALFGIVAALLAILLDKFEKRTFIILLLCYPILLYFSQSYLSGFLMVDVGNADGAFGASMASGQRYLEADLKKSGLGSIIFGFLEKTPHFLLAFLSFKFIRSNFFNSAPKDIKVFLRLQFFIVLLSSLFMFDLGANTETIFIRFLRFSVIPSCIILTYFYSIQYKFKYTKLVYYVALSSTIYSLLYTMHIAYVTNG